MSRLYKDMNRRVWVCIGVYRILIGVYIFIYVHEKKTKYPCIYKRHEQHANLSLVFTLSALALFVAAYVINIATEGWD